MKPLLHQPVVLTMILVLTQSYSNAQMKGKINQEHPITTIQTDRNMKTKKSKTAVLETSEIMQRFNNAFQQRDPAALATLIAEDCVMESIQGPNGVRYEGYQACLSFWQALATDASTRFDVEEIFVAGDRATIRWRYTWGEGENNSVRGVNLMQVRDGKIIEALGYAKTVPATGLDNEKK